MSIIERAGERMADKKNEKAKSVFEKADDLGWLNRPAAGQTPPAPQPPAATAARQDDAATPTVTPEAAASRPAESGSRSRQFAIDFAQLEAAGIITPSHRRSRLSEEVRLIKRRLLQRIREHAAVLPDGRPRLNNVFMITSARPSEGKSFVGINLALSFAIDEGLNVLLIDADVARPSIARTFGVTADRGLTDLLREPQTEMSSVLLRAQNMPLSLLAQGTHVASATELFGGDRMRLLVSEIASRYPDRIIIFDTPPLLATTEPVALAEQVGQVVFVVEAGKTSPDAVSSALNLVSRQADVSFVLNRCSYVATADDFGSYYDSYTR
jgi:exopolysaccharide/PEP-CTERM locus tyrosine autokinase